MDPQITWIALLQAWSNSQWFELIELAESLIEWLDKDGFPPDTDGPEQLGADWDRMVARSTAESALLLASDVVNASSPVSADVTFMLCCVDCGNESPETYPEALTLGWSSIQYVPSGNFIGRCPNCR
jgi:hypothetical protein